MQGILVRRFINSHGNVPKLLHRPDDPQGNFTSVGYQDLLFQRITSLFRQFSGRTRHNGPHSMYYLFRHEQRNTQRKREKRHRGTIPSKTLNFANYHTGFSRATFYVHKKRGGLHSWTDREFPAHRGPKNQAAAAPFFSRSANTSGR
jgi:hypothetical protein